MSSVSQLLQLNISSKFLLIESHKKSFNWINDNVRFEDNFGFMGLPVLLSILLIIISKLNKILFFKCIKVKYITNIFNTKP